MLFCLVISLGWVMLPHPQATSTDHVGPRTSELSIERRRRNHFTTAPLALWANSASRTLCLLFFLVFLFFVCSKKVLACLKTCLWIPDTYTQQVKSLFSAQFCLVKYTTGQILCQRWSDMNRTPGLSTIMPGLDSVIREWDLIVLDFTRSFLYHIRSLVQVKGSYAFDSLPKNIV